MKNSIKFVKIKFVKFALSDKKTFLCFILYYICGAGFGLSLILDLIFNKRLYNVFNF